MFHERGSDPQGSFSFPTWSEIVLKATLASLTLLLKRVHTLMAPNKIQNKQAPFDLPLELFRFL